jgi:hypothetical protein
MFKYLRKYIKQTLITNKILEFLSPDSEVTLQISVKCVKYVRLVIKTASMVSSENYGHYTEVTPQ